MINEGPHDAVSLHLAQLLNQHLFDDGGYRAAQLRESSDLATEQVDQDDELPAALEESQDEMSDARECAYRRDTKSAARP